MLPRVIALILEPANSCLSRLALGALVGGGWVAWSYGGMTPGGLHRAAEGGDLAHPFRGRHDQGAVHGADDRRGRLRRRFAGSGQRRNRWDSASTTTSVVKSIFLVIVVDGLFAIFFFLDRHVRGMGKMHPSQWLFRATPL